MARRRNFHGLALKRQAAPRGHDEISCENVLVFLFWWGVLTLGRQRFCETMFLEGALVAHGQI